MSSNIELIESLLWIDDKNGIVVPFKLNNVQRRFHEHKGYRNIILKARQLGISSSILGDMYAECITVPHTPCAVVSHETRATQRLLDRVQFFYDAQAEPNHGIVIEDLDHITHKYPQCLRVPTKWYDSVEVIPGLERTS